MVMFNTYLTFHVNYLTNNKEEYFRNITTNILPYILWLFHSYFYIFYSSLQLSLSLKASAFYLKA